MTGVAVAEACTVDAELFDDLAQAIAFVAERGGGVVHTAQATSEWIKKLELPANVQLKPPRTEAA